MILVLGDDGVLEVFPSPGEVALSIEALDAEECLVRVFDETAQPFRIEWVLPNRHGRSCFGLLPWTENGEYRLVPSGERDPTGLLQAIRAAKHVEPQSAERDVREIARELADAGHA
jgi:hypothetical protein